VPIELQTQPKNETGEAGRRRLLSRPFEPLFYADWQRAVFFHYEVDRVALQREVPFALDLREGKAYVSLVAFTMHGMRFRFGGKLGAWLCRPIATHHFLNARTYVRHHDERGIFFLSEWLSSPLCVCLGPLTFGLPYRLGRMSYRHDHENGALGGVVSTSRGAASLRYEVRLDAGAAFDMCAPGSLTEFLLDHYTAFTSRGTKRRFFRIWHEPWMQAPVRVKVLENSLIPGVWPWFRTAKLISANYSPGVEHVWMGWPHRIKQGDRQQSGVE
jgi:uncharacterized protein YqjF (DUF2071 family)